LLEKGAELEERDLAKAPLSVEELDALIGERDYREFLDHKNELYREQKLKEHPPSRREALALMAKNPNLVRRPIVIRGGRMVLGYDDEALGKLAG
jgi:arsenate reductase-like glutaredoxin family protein